MKNKMMKTTAAAREGWYLSGVIEVVTGRKRVSEHDKPVENEGIGVVHIRAIRCCLNHHEKALEVAGMECRGFEEEITSRA